MKKVIERTNFNSASFSIGLFIILDRKTKENIHMKIVIDAFGGDYSPEEIVSMSARTKAIEQLIENIK